MNLRSLAVSGLGLATVLTISVVPAEAEGPDDRTASSTSRPEAVPGPSADGAEEVAVAALEAVEALFTPAPGEGARARAVPQPTDVDATMAMRDLSARLDDLHGAQRERAERLLARPLSGQRTDADPTSINGAITSECPPGKTYCVHWTTAAPGLNPRDDRASASDVNATKKVLDTVIARYVGAGLRKPLSDGGNGSRAGNPNSRLDVYLMDLRSVGLYGYCANDGALPKGTYTAPVYCVLDNDFANYGTGPAKARKVTVAHEYFHAVQAAYDWLEDTWFMEGMAAWAEDEVYDNINDNVQYLRASQLTTPYLPLDYFDDSVNTGNAVQMSRYGSWLFFRHLSERWQKRIEPRSLKDPLVLARKILERADARAGGPDDHSTKAVARVVNAKAHKRAFKGGFARVYNEFALANRRPKKSYSEGKSYPAAAKPVVFRFGKATKKAATKAGLDRLPHLSSYTARLVPHKSHKAGTKVKVAVNLTRKAANPGVTVRVYRKNGKVGTTWLELNKKGKASKAFPFVAKKVKRIEVTVSNGSIASTCWQGAVDDPFTAGRQAFAWSCYGVPKHDGARHRLTATVKR